MSSRATELRLDRARVAVLAGGGSGERAISLQSGAAIAEALAMRAASVRAVSIDPRGQWQVEGETLEPTRALSALEDVDLFFLGLHGRGGEDGTLQGLLESAGRAYTGSGVAASALAMDKWWARAVVQQSGLGVARGRCLSRETWHAEKSRHLRQLDELRSADGWSVKPRRGGSSVATALVATAPELASGIERVFEEGDDCLVEEWVRGVEFTAPVLESVQGEASALAPVEIRPAPGRFFDFEQKYSEAGATELCPPESGGAALWSKLQEFGLEAHRALGCAGYSRSDFIAAQVAGRAELGTLVYLETNTLPGMTARSLLPRAAAQSGLDFHALCARIAENALARHARSVRS